MKNFMFVLSLIAGLSGSFFAEMALAKPILDRTVTVSAYVPEPIHPDSENPDLYWVHAMEFSYCGLEEKNPAFKVSPIGTAANPGLVISFDLCATKSAERMREYQNLITQLNPKGILKVLKAVYPQAPDVQFPLAKEFALQSSCVLPDMREGVLSCTVLTTGQAHADRLQSLFQYTTGLLTTGYLDYHVEGVNQGREGEFYETIGSYRAIYYVRGLQDYPHLFDLDHSLGTCMVVEFKNHVPSNEMQISVDARQVLLPWLLQTTDGFFKAKIIRQKETGADGLAVTLSAGAIQSAAFVPAPFSEINMAVSADGRKGQLMCAFGQGPAKP